MMKEQAVQLRIHCTCGQKMRVTQDMYGRPGKCVKCRQKLRIPRHDEIPPGGGEIYLADHPEFVRKAKAHRRDRGEVELRGEEEGEGARWDAPLDPLEPLQLLCSLELKAKRQLVDLDAASEQSSADPKRAVLAEQRARIQAARATLDEELRQRLMEVAVELASMRDKFDQVSLAVRVGEVGFEEFRGQMARIRRRRDCLERRQTNLRGWLSAQDPYVAGGYVEGSLEHVPEGPFRIDLAPEIPEEHGLVDAHIAELRRALTRRELAENELAQADNGNHSASSAADASERRQECEGERRRASSAAGFCRRRLEQLKNDYADDIRALESALNLARGRLQVGEVKRGQYDKAERAISQAKADLAKAINLISRALSANTAQDVPHPGGTYLGRLAHPGVAARVPLDAWLAWAASSALVVSLFVPVLEHVSPLKVFQQFGGNVPGVHWIISGPVLTALLLAGAACVPRRGLRGLLLGIIAILSCVAYVAFLHELHYDLGALGELVRRGDTLFLQPGTLLLFGALLVAMCASSLALLPVRGAWLAIPALCVLGLLGVVAVLTDFAGTLAPSPYVTISVDESQNDGQGSRVAVTVANEGRRTMLLSSNPDAAASPTRGPLTYVIALQRAADISTDAWEEVVLPREVRVGDIRRRPSLADLPDLPIAPGQNAVLNFRLLAGDYRVLLDGDLVDEFTVPGSEEAPLPSEEEGQEASPSPGTEVGPSSDSSSENLPKGVTVELRGIVTAPGREPRFSIDVYVPEEKPRQRSLAIGGVVYGVWEVKAYDPEGQTVTLTNSQRVLVLRRGERVPLDEDAPTMIPEGRRGGDFSELAAESFR